MIRVVLDTNITFSHIVGRDPRCDGALAAG